MARISDLDKITDPNDSNVLPISDGLTTKKITYLDLKTAITTQATNNRLGTVKVGNGLAIADDGTLSVTTFQGYSLPPATSNQLGGVIIGSGLNVSETGILSVSYTLPVATPTVSSAIATEEIKRLNPLKINDNFFILISIAIKNLRPLFNYWLIWITYNFKTLVNCHVAFRLRLFNHKKRRHHTISIN